MEGERLVARACDQIRRKGINQMAQRLINSETPEAHFLNILDTSHSRAKHKLMKQSLCLMQD